MDKTTIHWKSPEMIPGEDSMVVIRLDSGSILTGKVRYSMINIETGEHQAEVVIGWGVATWPRVDGWVYLDKVDHD